MEVLNGTEVYAINIPKVSKQLVINKDMLKRLELQRTL
jgi:hypothetical protein